MDATIEELLLLSGVIAFGFLLAVAFYESLSTRDVLIARSTRLARGVSRRRWVVGAAYLLTVAVGIPILVVLWAVVLQTVLFFVGSVERVESSALIAVSIVAAARILAYVRQKTAHELAKAIPLAFAFLLLTGGALNLEPKFARVLERPDATNLADEMVVFLIVLEVGLRLLADGSSAALAGVRRRRGIESDVGVWGTLWAAARRPLPPLPVDAQDAEPNSADTGAPEDAARLVGRDRAETPPG
jgi:hypothetical protein